MTSELPRHVLKWPEAGVEMAFRLIPAGDFLMGSRGYCADEEPVHRVRIVEDFWMAETPVTQAQFELWTTAEGDEHKNGFEGHRNHPAGNMDWRQAVAYCDWLGRVKALEMPEGCNLACLPTEAEWEYACRAGTETEYYTGDGEAALANAGWFGEDFKSGSTHPVQKKARNAFQLFDMHGNVDEWCHDAWDAAAYRGHVDGDSDPGWKARHRDWQEGLAQMAQSDQSRVLRGGSRSYSAAVCRSACRFWYPPGDPVGQFGFRVCLVRCPAEGRGAPGTDQVEEGTAPGDAGRGTRPESDGAGPAGAGKAANRGTHGKGRKPADHADHAEGESPNVGPAGAPGRRKHGRPDNRLFV